MVNVKFQSYDDIIITPKNERVFQNLNDYSQTSLDYFTHNFKINEEFNEYEQFWSLLKHQHSITENKLRLPSCSIENRFDYDFYLKRLHHCLWRRWSMKLSNTAVCKIDPLSLNWNKEIDLTILYGPNLSSSPSATASVKNNNKPPIIDSEVSNMNTNFKLIENKHFDNVVSCLANLKLKSKSSSEELIDEFEYFSDSRSSISSRSSSIFDKVSIQQKSNKKSKSLKFNDFVLRRDVDEKGKFFESHTYINDLTL